MNGHVGSGTSLAEDPWLDVDRDRQTDTQASPLRNLLGIEVQ